MLALVGFDVALDLSLIPAETLTPRLCTNPGRCRKLSALNKQVICFGCLDRKRSGVVVRILGGLMHPLGTGWAYDLAPSGWG